MRAGTHLVDSDTLFERESSMMHLHWSRVSPYVRKVLVCAHETGLAGQIELIDSRVSMTVPNLDLMRHNPLGKVPALMTDTGDVLFDSVVICEYLDAMARVPSDLFAIGKPQHWDALRWHAIGNGMADALILLYRELLRPEERQLPALIDILKLKLRACIPVLEASASRITAQPLHIGHIAVATSLAYIDFRFPEIAWRTGSDALLAWYEPFAARPSMLATAPA